MHPTKHNEVISKRFRIVVVPPNIRDQPGRCENFIEKLQRKKFHVLLLQVEQPPDNPESAFEQALPIRTSVSSYEIIVGSAKPKPHKPSIILLSEDWFHSGIVSGQFVYEPIS